MEALQRLHNRGSVSTGYDIDNSCKLEDDNNEWFYNASPTAGNRRIFTFSFWIKRSLIGSVNASGTQYVAGQGQHGRMYFSGDYFQFRFDDGHDVRDMTTKHRDPSAWLHVVVAVDTNQVSSSNRVKIYFNGVQTTTIDHDGGSYPDIEDQGAWFNTNYLTVGTAPFGGSYSAGDGDYDMSGYLADFAAVDGTQYAPTAFGEFDDDTGIWKPKDLSNITWGNEGFYLKFDDSSNMGKDSSGNSNNLTVNNIAAADQATDTPTNNFCTFNTLQNNTTSGTNPTFTEGATVVKRTTGAGWMVYITTIAVNKGKWYAEFELERTNALQMQGTLPVEYAQTGATTTEYYLGAQANGDGGVGWYGSGSNVYHGGGYTSSTAADGGDIIGVAIDCDNNKVHFRVNATWTNSSDPSNGNSGGFAINDELTYMVLCSQPATRTYKANFGGYTTISISSAQSDADGYGTFEHEPPSGYYALCTKNLEEYG